MEPVHQLERLIRAAFSLNVSDIHLKSNSPPMYRIAGTLCPVDYAPISAGDLANLGAQLSKMDRALLEQRSQTEFSYEWRSGHRVRGEYYRQRGLPALALRLIPNEVPSMEALRLPPVVKQFCRLTQGLVLVTGATGMGKSTTIAAMINEITRTSCRHVVTIEDPIEFMLPDNDSYVMQREVPRDVETVVEGLRGALRQDPDVIMIGEIRDSTTMRVAMRAAITGHLVISAAHFSDATSTLSGILGMAESDERAVWRYRLAECLRGVISQRLLPRASGKGRVLATEVLVQSPTITSSIQNAAKTSGIRAALDRDRNEYGSHTLDRSLLELVSTRTISLEVAKGVAYSPSELMRALNLGGLR